MTRLHKPRATRVLLLSSALGLAAMASSAYAQETAPGDFVQAIQAGTPILEVRPRHESAEIDGVSNADALTLRTRLGWQTGQWNQLQGLIEFEDVRVLSGDYNDGTPPAEPYATIADPETTELNRLQVVWTPSETFKATLGRQRIAFDDQRFVGAVAWRQDEQTFDALRFDLNQGGFSASYAFIDHVNRIFAEELDWDSQSHLLNAGYSFGPKLKLTAFAYLMDFEGGGEALSNATYGVRATGSAPLGPVQLAYAASYATQTDHGGNPNAYDADYFSFDLNATHGPLSLRAGIESLEGEGPGRRFVTPLATGHAFQGWADVFLLTPNDGVTDVYVAPTFRPAFSAPYLSSPSLTIAWHDFEAERTGADLGEELDVIATASITRRLSVLIKYADYDGTGAPAETTRTWLGFEFKI